jgi:hypothetical protein
MISKGQIMSTPVSARKSNLEDSSSNRKLAKKKKSSQKVIQNYESILSLKVSKTYFCKFGMIF